MVHTSVTGREDGIRAVIVLAAVDWEDLKQRPHHLSEAWACLGLRVLFIENAGTRRLQVQDLGRVTRRVRNRITGRSVHLSSMRGVDTYSPLALPGMGSLAIHLNSRSLIRRVHRYLDSIQIPAQEAAFVTYLPTEVAVRIVTAFRWALTIYDVVADVTAAKPHLAHSEAALLAVCNRITSASHTLGTVFQARSGKSVDYIPDGAPDAPSLSSTMPHRVRLLYLGGINARIDLGLLEFVARARPDWEVVLFGDIGIDIERLLVFPNIRHMPRAARYEDIWPVISQCSVGLIPYAGSLYVDGMHPAKLQEYLLGGLPVVATATSEMEWIRSQMGDDVVFTASDPTGFVSAIERALEEDSVAKRLDRHQRASQRTWPQVAKEFLS